MTVELEEMFKKFFLTAGFFILLAIIISILSFFIKPNYEEKLKKNVEELLSITQKKDFHLSEATQIKKTTFSSLNAWFIEGAKNTDKVVFIMAITGDAGPYTGVFLFSKNTGTEFCGLLGLPESVYNPTQFGITERLIKYRIKMIENSADRGVLSYEK